MPIFPNVPTSQPSIAPIPTTSIDQPLVVTLIASTSSNELGELKDMMQALMKNVDKRFQDQSSVVWKMRNTLVTLVRQQAQNNKPI